MAQIVYNLLLFMLSPALLLVYLHRVFVSRKSRLSWRENAGGLPRLSLRPPGTPLVWIHAASVGEVMASLPVQEELHRRLPDAMLLLTTITQTGNEVARQSAGRASAVAYLPMDLLPVVRRALRRVRPDALVLVESEIWPNLISAARRGGVPVVLVNGRISDRTMARYDRTGGILRRLTSWCFSKISTLCMQTETDAERIIALGADTGKVSVTGSTKFDQEGGRLGVEASTALRSSLGIPPGARVFVAGSTNEGEDEPVMEAFALMRAECPDLTLIVAPRQLERTGRIVEMARSRGFKCLTRSGQKGGEFDILVLDTFGELAAVYGAGDITFVGGTLIPKGGHSLVQPIVQGKPVLFGPFTFKTRDIAEMCRAFGVGFEVTGAADLAKQGAELLLDRRRLEAIRIRCEELVAANVGAAGRCADAVVRALQEGRLVP